MDDSVDPSLSGLGRYARLDTASRSERPRRSGVDRRLPPAAPPITPWHLDLAKILQWLMPGRFAILGVTICGAALGLAFGTLATPRYTASTDLLVNPAKLQVVADDIYDPGAARESQLLDAESKLRVLTSGNVLARVVSALNLQEDPEFVSPPRAGFGFGSSAGDPVPPELEAQRSLFERVRARREERSFIVTLSVWSEDPQKAVLISEALVKAFQTELIQADSDGAGRTAQSLMDRLAELRSSVNEAEERVEAFKRQHQLQSTEGELVSATSMALLNTQVIEAQRQLVEAESRYQDLVNSASSDTNSAALQSQTIATLRAQYATAKQQYDAQTLLLGPRHPRLRTLRAEMETIASEVAAETQRLVDAAKAAVDQATATLQELTAQTAAARLTLSLDNEAQVQLRELERDATSKATIYEAFLTRARAVTERQQLDTTNIRVISPATIPESRSWPPRTMQTTIAGSAGGLTLGVLLAGALGIFADYRRRTPPGRPVDSK